MSYGVPVISSDAFSLAEVVGQGGLLVPPHDVGSYSESMSKILSSSKLRKSLIEKGQNRVRQLKWTKTATKMLNIVYGERNYD